MFLKKTSVIAAFRIVSVLFVMCMFYFFLRITVTVTNEETKSDNEISIEKSYQLERNDDNQQIHISQLDHIKIYNQYQSDDCKTTYLMYYASALILGAYVNFKKLYKMGPI